MNKERAENDYGSHTALAPSKENYYSTIKQDFLNITALSMSSSSLYDTGDKSWSRPKDFHLEPMYIDVLERSTPRKSSRKMKCLVTWMIILTLMSLASFKTIKQLLLVHFSTKRTSFSLVLQYHLLQLIPLFPTFNFFNSL